LLNSVFGLPGFRGAQEEIVRHVAGGGNCLVLMPTGGGKSLCYQLPAPVARRLRRRSRTRGREPTVDGALIESHGVERRRR